MADASTNKKTLKTGSTGFVKSINFLIDNQPQPYLRKMAGFGFQIIIIFRFL
jgi:hypothetical protein